MSCFIINQTAVEKAESELGVTFLKLDWIDMTSFCITDDSLSACCRFIYHARSTGASVLVHCAQVKLVHTYSLSPCPSQKPAWE